MSSTTLSNRLAALISARTEPSRKFKALEEQTGIPADRWSSFSLGRQRPTAEMIEAAARLWPEHAFWLATGLDDEIYGHVAVNAEARHSRDEFTLRLNEPKEPDPFFQERLAEERFSRWNNILHSGQRAFSNQLAEQEEWMKFLARPRNGPAKK